MQPVEKLDESMSEFYEYEYKFNAEKIKLDKFVEFAESLKPNSNLTTSSWDHYYSNEDGFIRFRDSETPELTIKRKLSNHNNWKRVEVDIPLDNKRINLNTVNKFVGLEGYKPHFKIYKSCFIYWYENFNLVYYIVYDKGMNEIGRFLEVEINKNKLNEITLEQVDSILNEVTSNLAVLGISNKNRLKKSLFETYSKVLTI